MFSLVVLISGNGSNLQAILDAIQEGSLQAEVKAVISNKVTAFGLERAQKVGIPTHVVSKKDYPDKKDYDEALLNVMAPYNADLVVLAGFMRVLGDKVVQRYRDKMINLHPALLPKYPGLHTHERALEAGDTEHGSTIHLVTEELDEGPAICQAKLNILEEDTSETLKTRVQHLEHKMLPLVVQWFSEGRLRAKNLTLTFDGEPLKGPIIIQE